MDVHTNLHPYVCADEQLYTDRDRYDGIYRYFHINPNQYAGSHQHPYAYIHINAVEYSYKDLYPCSDEYLHLHSYIDGYAVKYCHADKHTHSDVYHYVDLYSHRRFELLGGACLERELRLLRHRG